MSFRHPVHLAIHSAIEGVDALFLSDNEKLSVEAFEYTKEYCSGGGIEFWSAYHPRRILLHKGTVYFDTSDKDYPNVKVFKDV